MALLWSQVLTALHETGIAHCVLRGEDEPASPRRTAEVDLLVSPQHVPRLDACLAALAFVRLRRTGHAPHRFYIGYDAVSDQWLKLDVVTSIAFGSPIPAIRTPLGPVCLDRRRRDGDIMRPAPEHELLLLLLHGVLDKRDFAPARQARIVSLCSEVDPAILAPLLAEYWIPGDSWAELHTRIAAGKWDELLALRPLLVSRLTRVNRIRMIGRILRDRLLRKLHRWYRLLRPEARTVALLAPDGAGKSTVAASLCETFFFPARLLYMGMAPRRPVHRFQGLPGFGFAAMLIRQWGAYLAARLHQARGRLVVFDRYTYDALLPPRRPLRRLSRLRRWLLARSCPAPDLVLVLDAPGEVLFARKGEHDVSELERQRQSYLALRHRLRNVAVIDAGRDAQQVRRDVTARIWRCYAGSIQETP